MSPTIILLNAHIQKSVLKVVIKLPSSNVARHEKYENRRPYRSLSIPKTNTPTGPPMLSATKPKVG